MASLTHVCMWTDEGWKRISAVEAAKLHPGGTVSARSGLFICELCGQYVSFSAGNRYERHFKHSLGEKNKDCLDRTSEIGHSSSYGFQEPNLPLRITGVTSSSFRFEIGLIRIPKDLLSKDFSLEIKPKGAPNTSYVFGRERLNCDSITYLPIGGRPFENYTLSFQNGSRKLREFWPAEIEGIDPKGTLFEKVSGKKLMYDDDVEIRKEYYLLKRDDFFSSSRSSIRIRRISQKNYGKEIWTLYVVSASVFNEDAARFYLDFHCRLTDHPVSLQLVWPLFIKGKYLVKHNQNYMYILVEGNTTAVKAFPSANIHSLSKGASQSKLYKIFCSNRQQLICAGRTQALQYTYFWREPLKQEGTPPEVSVIDLAGNEIAAGVTSVLPRNKTLCFKSEFDGELIISNNRHVVDKRKISSDKIVELGELTYGLCVQVVIGLDIVWQIEFRKQQNYVVNDEISILKQIINVSGREIPVPHSLRNILAGMSQYPQICQWIRKCIKKGTIDERSYRQLQYTYRSMNR